MSRDKTPRYAVQFCTRRGSVGQTSAKNSRHSFTSPSQKMSDSTEILLTPDRLHLFPIKYSDLWQLYKQSEASFWTVEEVDLGNDRRDFESLSPSEQHFISHVLAFFATADGIVFDNIDCNFGEEVQIREAKTFYGFQRMMEGIHNEMYSLMVESLIQDARKREEIFRAVETSPGLKAKAEWARKYMSRTVPFGQRLVAFVIMEYLLFSASFAAIFYFKKSNKMHGLCFSNELISRDEGLHAKFGCVLFNNYLSAKPSEEVIHEMVREAVSIEQEFVRESLPVAFIGMNADHMTQYVKFVADHMLVALKQKKLYDVPNPFPWMDMISLQDKTNFFEKRVSAYSKAGVGTSEIDEKAELQFDADF